MTTDKTDPKKPPTWPNPGEPPPSPPELLAPVIQWLADNFRLTRRRDTLPSAQHYQGFPVTVDTCPDPDQILDEAHGKAREAQGLPLTNGAELAFLVAFQLGVEAERRRAKARAGSGSAGNRKATKPPAKQMPGRERGFF